MKKMLIAFAAVCTLIACSEKTSPTVVEPAPQPSTVAMTAEAEQGKSIFEASCQKCHALKVIDDYSQEKWAKILPIMAGKAKLDASQTAIVDAYVQWELAN